MHDTTDNDAAHARQPARGQHFHNRPLGAPLPEKNLRAIRAALVVPEDREAFDAGLKAVLDEVRVSLDLGALNSFVHRWWITACDTLKDPEGRRQMHARARQALAGEPVPQGRPWREILAARGIDV
ncbi:DUF6247 family protein [Nonomuraea rhodomycinica]|uniref:DUF6247 family protein n=1 Tax=Nonomuraea rhodomycinica TaxID=1712872 RepID=UPI001FE2FBC0|nr:DUF6247 family protein [Nonomuraea rhodomycinica]